VGQQPTLIDRGKRRRDGEEEAGGKKKQRGEDGFVQKAKDLVSFFSRTLPERAAAD